MATEIYVYADWVNTDSVETTEQTYGQWWDPDEAGGGGATVPILMHHYKQIMGVN